MGDTMVRQQCWAFVYAPPMTFALAQANSGPGGGSPRIWKYKMDAINVLPKPVKKIQQEQDPHFNRVIFTHAQTDSRTLPPDFDSRGFRPTFPTCARSTFAPAPAFAPASHPEAQP